MDPTRLTFFLDLAPDEYAEAVAFWCAATGYDLSPSRGEHGEFASLVPPSGDDHLRVQRLEEGPSGVHLDLYVEDLDAALEHAADSGATLVSRDGHAVLRSPGGFPFCLVPGPVATPSEPSVWPADAADAAGHRSRIDQLCLDIGPSAYAAECAFWEALTGWPTQLTPRGEFTRLRVRPALRMRILLQRLEHDEGPVRGHLDVATDDRAAEVRRLTALGAVPIGEGSMWTVLRPPAGPVVCVTGRDPVTGHTSG